MEDQLYYLGSAVKSTAPGMIKGYAIRFGSPNDTDLENDYFSPETDFGRPLKVGDSFKMNLYYHHGQDSVLKSIAVGSGIITMDDKGLWMEAQIDMANEYGKMIDEMAKMGKLGYSSGATSHLVERQKNGKSYLIKSWPIGEVSVTPTPAESRNKVMKLINFKAKIDDVSVGDYVRWSSSGGSSRGRIESIEMNGTISAKPQGPSMEGTEDNPAIGVRVYQESSDGSFERSDVITVHRVDSLTKIPKPKSYFMEDKSDYEMPMNGQYGGEEVEDMVEGLVDLGATPEMLVESIYAETNAELVSEAIHKLFYSMCEGLDAVLESGYSIEYVNALIDGFSMRAKDVAARLYDQPMAEMQSLKLYTKGPKTVREIEKCLRDVMHFSTNQSKALAGIIKDNLRDEIVTDEIKNKNISSEEEIANPVVNDDNIKNALMKKLMLDLMR
jgi:HK97 family phage prohead protease